jgi:hypothetical protein
MGRPTKIPLRPLTVAEEQALEVLQRRHGAPARPGRARRGLARCGPWRFVHRRRPAGGASLG